MKWYDLTGNNPDWEKQRKKRRRRWNKESQDMNCWKGYRYIGVCYMILFVFYLYYFTCLCICLTCPKMKRFLQGSYLRVFKVQSTFELIWNISVCVCVFVTVCANNLKFREWIQYKCLYYTRYSSQSASVTSGKT
jgi:hypothetical protein